MPDDKKVIIDILSKLGATSPKGRAGADWFGQLENKSEEVRKMEELENNEILARRRRWADWILFFIGLIVVFDIVLVVFYGAGWWSFTDSKVVIAVVTDNFLKIFGLGYLITQETFRKIYA